MKVKLIIVFLFVISQIKAQYSEFKLHDNGLIYSETSMSKLKRIVDSLNLKFKVCDLSKKYYSNRQAIAHHLSLDGNKAKEAKADIEKNISFDDFIKKYPKTKVVEKLVVIANQYKDYDNKSVLEFFNLELSERDNFNFYFRDQNESEVIHGNWIYDYNEKGKYSGEGINAYYLVKPFESLLLPQKYSKLIQYSDCLIDTTATIFNENAKKTYRYYDESVPNKPRAFNDYVEKVLKRPEFDNEKFDVIMGMDTIDFERPNKKLSKKERLEREKRAVVIEKEFEKFGEKMDIWESSRLTRIDSLKNNDPNFMPKLLEAYAEAKINSASEDQFEEYVGLYISKEAELELKRNRRVVGGCSMDDSPRRHALSIAILSAETTKWEIFLQSHLNIMNDRFDRVSDGSWAQQGRSTYIREIEDLEINVLDLLFGISLRLENPAENHYFGSINRLGRALSESKNKTEFENRALAMIEDNELDTYNRLLVYYLFRNYNHNLEDENHQKTNMEKLKVSISKLPDYVVNKIDLN
ncbi:hypothetical protein HKT18_11175 [Flavobacterium sp. IMCC34852]|uniref:Uncharacterized protein n=1 Tax=Flavobacterium rivulicola TaxID=2732161 RepID=A0A7Y3RA75_9FLAO|nr:hypothetical protein [Flavobacterium sp. IMCC34852]NNT72778.1 hypothetical protein [Flavobacterium sp. IMCC34852]